MNTAPQELLKEYVKNQHFISTAEIMAAMKEMFRDVVQMATEMELWTRNWAGNAASGRRLLRQHPTIATGTPGKR